MPYKVQPVGPCNSCRRHGRLPAKGLCGTCYNKDRATPISRACEQCGKWFTRRVHPTQAPRFCSKSCSNKATADRLGDMHLRCKSKERAAPIEERYWRHVIVNEVGCWGWDGATNKAGYGILSGEGRGSLNVLAHRLAWKIHNGAPPGELHVLHKCDNPPCTRPNDLFLGTNADNVADMVSKGRNKIPGLYGSAHALSKLTETIVQEARARCAAGETNLALAREYGVAKATMSAAIKGKTWAHVA